jgi:hypothetical protein
VWRNNVSAAAKAAATEVDCGPRDGGLLGVGGGRQWTQCQSAVAEGAVREGAVTEGAVTEGAVAQGAGSERGCSVRGLCAEGAQ